MVLADSITLLWKATHFPLPFHDVSSERRIKESSSFCHPNSIRQGTLWSDLFSFLFFFFSPPPLFIRKNLSKKQSVILRFIMLILQQVWHVPESNTLMVYLWALLFPLKKRPWICFHMSNIDLEILKAASIHQKHEN